jgi:hypothetical protein
MKSLPIVADESTAHASRNVNDKQGDSDSSIEVIRDKVKHIIKNGDIFALTKTLEDIRDHDFAWDIETIESLGKAMLKFIDSSFIPIEYAERLLSTIGVIMEVKLTEQQLFLFASSTPFIECLIKIIISYSQRLRSISINHGSFSSHYCYELTLYILLGILEKVKLLALFLKNAPKSSLILLFRSISEIILRDQLFLTQVTHLKLKFFYFETINIIHRKWD